MTASSLPRAGHPSTAAEAAVNAPPQGFRQALDQLRSAQKSPKGAPAYSRFVNRRLGRLLAAAAHPAGLTPNQVTAISGLFTFSGIAVLAAVRPSAPVGLAVCLALVLGYALDSADGQLARLRGGGTPVGEWLDHVVDSAKIPLLHLAVAVSCFRFSTLGRGAYLLIPLAFAVIATATFFSMILSDFLRRLRLAGADAGAPAAGASAGAGTGAAASVGAGAGAGAVHAPVWRSLLVLPSDYGLLCLVFVLLGAGSAFSAPFAVTYAALAAANALYLLGALARGYRAMSALGASTPRPGGLNPSRHPDPDPSGTVPVIAASGTTGAVLPRRSPAVVPTAGSPAGADTAAARTTTTVGPGGR
ncbi:CDP-alcohol phosphatidyltransferase family protein [Frankia sp. Cpl3]|uniref:CDP-alcohol phosphatidyltransferase family protein n=1 Tax=Parafrankia colletiae TaxID=573497 RepID=UPI000A0125EF|nr:CDP-alcohol phosphatidyltransferase family protein [Parafrankia colletiae]MCK9899966.1 CDP-alcohol phosphatidyltransferase family protein [Frankia sp. Cpl3]